MWVVMSAAEREEFLAGVRVGVLSAAVGTAGRTLAVPVWYSYRPGGLLTALTRRRFGAHLTTQQSRQLASLLEQASAGAESGISGKVGR